MAEFDLGGEVFTLDSDAGFDVGIVRADVGAGSRMKFATRFELCHGLSAELSAEVIADAAADLGLLWIIAGRAEGEALAAAGVQLDAQATVDLFDRVGLSAEAAAFAEAAIAGRLSLAFDLQDIALAGRDLLPGPAYDAFLAFLREVKIGGGVWAKIAFAAMARAHLNVRGSLADDRDAGFVVEQGSEAGLGAGMGYDFYAGIRFDNPKRFFLNAVDIVTGAVVQEARPLLPRAFGPQLTALEYALPATLAIAYELGQLVAQEAVNEGAADVLVGCCVAEMQRFVLDKVGLAGGTLIARGLEDLAAEIASIDLTDSQRRAIADACRSLITTLRGEALTFTAVQTAIPVLADVFKELAPETHPGQWRPLLAATWLAFASAEAVRQGIRPAHAGASADLIGLRREAAEAFLISLPQTPDIVSEELEPFIGAVPDQLELAVVVDYLVGTHLLALLEPIVPDLYALLELISRQTGIDVSDLVEAALRAGLGDDLTQTELYDALRAVMGTALDDLILGTLLPALRNGLPQGSDARVWVDEVAHPSLTMMRDFALVRIDDLVAGRSSFTDLSSDSLRTGLSLMIGKVVLSNVVVLSDILLSHVMDSLSDAAGELSTAVREGNDDVIGPAATMMLESFLPAILPRPDNLAAAARRLAAELLLALSEATSDDVFTDAQRATSRALMRRILFSVYGEADLSGPDELDDFLAQVAACVYIPAPDAVADLIRVQTETVAAQLAIALPRIAAALERFLLDVTLGPFEEYELAARERFEEEKARIVRLGRDLVTLSREIAQFITDAAAFAALVRDQLDDVKTAMRRAARRTEILNALELLGRTRAAANAHLVVPFFDRLSANDQRNVRVGAANVFSAAYAGITPLLDGALEVVAEVAGEVADLFDAASNLSELIAALAETVTDRVEQTVNDLAGLQLPTELSVDDVARTAAEVITGLPLIGTALANAFNFRAQEQSTDRDRAASERKQAKKAAFKRQAEDRQARAVARGPARITICNPQPLSDDLDDAWAYGDDVPVAISIHNVEASPSPADGRAPAGTFLALNGVSIKIPADAWTGDDDRRTLSHTLTSTNSALRPGPNVLECSLADGVNPSVRASVLFLGHAAPASDEATTTVVDDGQLTIRTGRLPVRVDGWRAYHSHNGRRAPGGHRAPVGPQSVHEPGIPAASAERFSARREERTARATPAAT